MRGAIILCGGRSSRMGCDKASMPFGTGGTMLGTVIRRVAEVVPRDAIVCVAAMDQVLPELPAGVQAIHDTISYAGPLAGLLDGIRALSDRVDAVFACGCDAPLLVPAVVENLFAELVSHQIAAPYDGTHLYPLPAVYRTSVVATAESLLAGGEHSLVALLSRCDTCHVRADSLRDIDPELLSLAPCNSRQEYEAALRSFEP